MTRRVLNLLIAALAVTLVVAMSLAGLRAGQGAAARVAIDNDDIGGVVTGPSGPEAGVWVIAETKSLPTRLIKSVVTDDQGRYRASGSAERRTTTCGFAAMASWIHRRFRERPARR